MSASIIIDGQMCEDIRVGIAVRSELQRVGTWRRKDQPNGYDISFSSTLLEMAGGIQRLFAEWEQIPWHEADKKK